MFESEIRAHSTLSFKGSLAGSTAIHAVALLIALSLWLLQRQWLPAPEYRLVPLVSIPHERAGLEEKIAAALNEPAVLPLTPVEESSPGATILPGDVAPPVLQSAGNGMRTAPVLVPISPPTRPAPLVNTFPATEHLKSTSRAPRDVQTGGFGDPNGIRGEGRAGGRSTIARLGSFDLPSGAGTGNGSGQGRGVSRTVVASQFGSVVDSRGETRLRGGGGSGPGAGAVQTGGFGDLHPSTGSSGVVGGTPAPAPKTTPAEILVKPQPVYTTEARNLRLEGEVSIEVVLPASGKPKPLRIIHGLGHGLDEAAIKAVEQIQFKPAMQDGKPIDTTVVFYVVFQLT